MRILIFDNTLTGHHLEYLNLIYRGCISRKENTYIFAVPKNEWENKKILCDWPMSDNVEWVMLNDRSCTESKAGSLLSSCYKQSKMVKDIAIKENVDSIFLISLAGFVPFLPLLLPEKIKLSGIIYKIFLRRKISKVRLMIEKLRYALLAKSSVVEKVLILNDPKSSIFFNKNYNCNKFIPLADPVPQKTTNIISLRDKYNIDQNTLVFLHFGSMDLRKGTLDILKSIDLLSPLEVRDKVFIFAGKISNTISEKFNTLVDQLNKRNIRIIVEDRFCEYEHLNNLCYTCDCILIPYHFTDLSSGALGYAALYNKPVIGPTSGLIGELIRDNELGMCLENITPENLCSAIGNFKRFETKSDYAVRNSSEAFTKTILK